jgi:hypothetical protein
MKAIHMFIVATAMSGGLIGCQDNGPGPKHEQVQEKTVTDPNGNVVSHSEQKTDEKSTSTNGMNP